MEERRRCTTVRQLELLVQFLEKNLDLALGNVRSKEARADAARLWRECTEVLNAEGPARTEKEWPKLWNDYKCRLRSKVASINANQQADGLSSVHSLTELEGRVVNNILSKNTSRQSSIRQEQLHSNHNSNGGNEEVLEVVQEELQNVHPEAPSAILLNIYEADQPVEYVSMKMSPVHAQNMPASPARSITGQAPSHPSTPSSTGGPQRRRTEMRSRRRMTQTTKSILQESIAMVLRTEELRAQADLRNAETLHSFSESFKLLAQSVDRFSQMYCLHHGQKE